MALLGTLLRLWCAKSPGVLVIWWSLSVSLFLEYCCLYQHLVVLKMYQQNSAPRGIIFTVFNKNSNVYVTFSSGAIVIVVSVWKRLAEVLMSWFIPGMDPQKQNILNLGRIPASKNSFSKMYLLKCRCTSKKCRAGYFYGFKTKGHKLYYDNNCLERPYFFTSRKTGYYSK